MINLVSKKMPAMIGVSLLKQFTIIQIHYDNCDLPYSSKVEFTSLVVEHKALNLSTVSWS